MYIPTIFMEIKAVGFIFTILGVLIAGAVVGFVVSRKVFKRYLEKNPPVNENMIRAMMSQMGRKPSEKDINRVINRMNQHSPEQKAKTQTEEEKVKSKKFIR